MADQDVHNDNSFMASIRDNAADEAELRGFAVSPPDCCPGHSTGNRYRQHSGAWLHRRARIWHTRGTGRWGYHAKRVKSGHMISVDGDRGHSYHSG